MPDPTPTPWKPAPEGPPPDRRSNNAELYAWLEAHPGEWAVIERASTGTATTLTKRGYQVTTRAVEPLDGRPRFNVYVRVRPDA